MKKIQDIFESLEIVNIKNSLNSCRNEIKKLNLEILELDKEKKKVVIVLKEKESRMKRAIYNEIEPGTTKRKYTNETMRDIEFINRSAMDPEIAKHRGDLISLNENIYHKKVLVDVEVEHNKELLLDYKMAVALIPCFLEGE